MSHYRERFLLLAVEVSAGTLILNIVTINLHHTLPSTYLNELLSGEDAYKKIRAGAILVQLYTSFAYGGPALIPRIKVQVLVVSNMILVAR